MPKVVKIKRLFRQLLPELGDGWKEAKVSSKFVEVGSRLANDVVTFGQVDFDAYDLVHLLDMVMWNRHETTKITIQHLQFLCSLLGSAAHSRRATFEDTFLRLLVSLGDGESIKRSSMNKNQVRLQSRTEFEDRYGFSFDVKLRRDSFRGQHEGVEFTSLISR